MESIVDAITVKTYASINNIIVWTGSSRIGHCLIFEINPDLDLSERKLFVARRTPSKAKQNKCV